MGVDNKVMVNGLVDRYKASLITKGCTHKNWL
jgi:hypothetical protein